MTETGIKLRSDRFKSVKVTAPSAGYTRGQIVAAGYLVGVIVETAALAAETTLVYNCEKIVVTKTAGSGITFTVGAKVYYDGSGAVTNVASGNTLCGRALEIAAAAATTVEINLTGDVVA